MLQANKVLRLAMRCQEKIVQFTKRNQPDENLKGRLRSAWPFSIGHNVDLDMTLPFLLGPVPWSLSTPDRISTKTDKSKLPHGLQLHIKPTLDWPCSAAHNFDGNAKLHSVISFPVTFKDLMEPIFNQALKAGHVGFVTDTYIQCLSSSL